MLLSKLVRTDELEIDGHSYVVRYYETETIRGTIRYCSEVALGATDRIIVDGYSLSSLESKVLRLVPATIYSHALAARSVAA